MPSSDAAPATADVGASAAADPLRSLLHATRLVAPECLATIVAEHAQLLGADEVVLYLADYDQRVLHPLPGAGVPSRQQLTVDGSVAGLAFRRVEATRAPEKNSPQRLWLPLLNGTNRLGVAEVVAAEITDALEAEARALTAVVADLIAVHDTHSDVFARLRRRKSLSLAAEIQWELLPPLSFATDRVSIAGALEPGYDIGGDSFDYAVNGSCADFLMLDAVGHGLPAALLASVAIGSYRHARRDGLDLPDISAAMNSTISDQFSGSRFATAAIARLDLHTGQLQWVNAGHAAPLVVRDGSVIEPPPCPPHPPLGLQKDEPGICLFQLQPGDRVMLYTDGIVEARTPGGEYFGEERLADFLIRAMTAGDPLPETLRRLVAAVLAHQADQLSDDASVVLVEWPAQGSDADT